MAGTVAASLPNPFGQSRNYFVFYCCVRMVKTCQRRDASVSHAFFGSQFMFLGHHQVAGLLGGTRIQLGRAAQVGQRLRPPALPPLDEAGHEVPVIIIGPEPRHALEIGQRPGVVPQRVVIKLAGNRISSLTIR